MIFSGAKLDNKCIYTEQCQHFDENAVCAEVISNYFFSSLINLTDWPSGLKGYLSFHQIPVKKIKTLSRLYVTFTKVGNLIDAANDAIFQRSQEISYCVCSEGYSKELSHNTASPEHVCHVTRTNSHVEDVATLAGLAIGLVLLSLFICFTLRLFSKARNAESRQDSNFLNLSSSILIS